VAQGGLLHPGHELQEGLSRLHCRRQPATCSMTSLPVCMLGFLQEQVGVCWEPTFGPDSLDIPSAKPSLQHWKGGFGRWWAVVESCPKHEEEVVHYMFFTGDTLSFTSSNNPQTHREGHWVTGVGGGKGKVFPFKYIYCISWKDDKGKQSPWEDAAPEGLAQVPSPVATTACTRCERRTRQSRPQSQGLTSNLTPQLI